MTNVIIEINGKSNLNELQDMLKEDGETKFKLRLKKKVQKFILFR